LRDTLEAILAEGLENGFVEDAAIADSGAQTKAFWHIREMFAEVQRRIGVSIKHDISVPIASVPEFIARAHAATRAAFPGSRPLAFGHLGDGNIHYNVIQPEGTDKDAWVKRWSEVNKVVWDIVLSLGGSISAEHGVGVMKRDELPSIKNPVAYALMQSLKRMLDPNGILNPGKVL
jgi:FAD/FMN-containing dehydrogenase